MSKVTVKQLASTVGIPVERLLAQLNEAGIYAYGTDATLTEQEKLQLLSYLRRSHGKSESNNVAITNQVTLQRQPETAHPGLTNQTIYPNAHMSRQIGEIKWFDGKKGYGFIKFDEEKGLYLHKRQLHCDSRRLMPGQYITYEIGQHNGKTEAKNVKLLEDETDELVLGQAFLPEHAQTAVIAARLLFPKISLRTQIKLSLSVLPYLDDHQQQHLLRLIPNSTLLSSDASPLRHLASIQRKLDIWRSADDPTIFINEIEMSLAKPEAIGFDRTERAMLIQRLPDKILLLPRSGALRHFLSLGERFRLYARLNDYSDFADEVAAAICTNQAMSDQLPDTPLLLSSARALRPLLSLEKRFRLYTHIEDFSAFSGEIEAAIREEGNLPEQNSPSRHFWETQMSLEPGCHLFSLAPDYFKRHYWQSRYSGFVDTIRGCVSADNLPRAAWNPIEVYGDSILPEDRNLAAQWTSDDQADSDTMARMVSARCAEKIVKRFYENLGLYVEDIAIHQVTRQSQEWLTHDLLLGGQQPVDVKNSRCPTNSNGNFYVEHTVPRFKKRDGSGADVTISVVLSPYLQQKYLEKPSSIPKNWAVSDVRVLGETSRPQIAQLESLFFSETFKVFSVSDRVVPYWIVDFCPLYYAAQEKTAAFLRDCNNLPPDDAWDFLEVNPIPSFLRAGIKLPARIKRYLAPWQLDLFNKILDSRIESRLTRPYLYLSLLTHFLSVLALSEIPIGFHPMGYKKLLFPDANQSVNASQNWGNSNFRETSQMYPAGLYDPLRFIWGLCVTLGILWNNRKASQLQRFQEFRLYGLGLLQGRENDRQAWTTIVAYCGGSILEDGKWKGYCGNHPLVLGKDAACQVCKKLVCEKCRFCSKGCREGIRRQNAKDGPPIDCGNPEYYTNCEETGYYSEHEEVDYCAIYASWDDFSPF